MDPVELLIRGLVALAAMAVLVVAARARFRSGRDDGSPSDIGLD